MNDFFQNDPWGDTLTPEAPDTSNSSFENTSVAPTKEGTITQDDSENFVITLKGGPGYDAPWIVIRGGDAEVAKKRVLEAHRSGLMETVLKASQAFSGSAPKPPAPAAPMQAPAQPQMGGDTPTCDHGARIFRSGTSAKGPWSAWFCPAGRDSGCAPKWGK